MGKKGASQIVGAAVLIAITVAAVAGVWTIINTYVVDRLDTAEACNQVLDNIELNNDYVCYNYTTNHTLVSINIKDIDIDSILVSLNYENENMVFELTNESTLVAGVSPYMSIETEIRMPSKEGGRTYVIKGDKPKSVSISPMIKGVQCDIADSINSIPSCI